MTPKKIAVLTGKRGGYDAMLPMLRNMQQDPYFELSMIVCDQHLMEAFGLTGDAISTEFLTYYANPIDRGDYPISRLMNLGKYVGDIALTLKRIEPDLLIIFGDRGESVSGALAAVEMGIPIAHIQGGDISGNVDDLYRNMITQAANIHFPSNTRSAMRLNALGVMDDVIFEPGDLHLDPIAHMQGAIVKKDRITVLIHPESHSDQASTQAKMKEVMDAADALSVELDCVTHFIYPCSDPGYQTIINCIEQGLYISYKNLPVEEWALQLKKSKVFLTNSSSGLIDAPFLRTPSVIIGTRQAGRLTPSSCSKCDWNKKDIIYSAKMAMKRPPDPYRYGRGDAGQEVIKCIKEVFNDPLGYALERKYLI